MAVYVAKQPGFGDRIGLFAGIDDVPLQARREPGDTLRLEITMDKLGGRFGGAGGSRASTARPPARRPSASSSRPKGRSDDAPHRCCPTSTAMRSRSRPCARRCGPRSRTRSRSPAISCSTARIRRARSTSCARWSDDGAAIVSGNTDIAVADFDYAAAFPWMSDGVPDVFRAAAEWAHDELGDERLAWLRRLPAERRLRAEDGTLILVCHASPGSQTAGFDQDLDPNVGHRARRPDRCAGHRLRPHPPARGPRPRLEAHRQRRVGRLRLRRRPDAPRGR